MKKLIAVLITLILLTSSVTVLTLTASADEGIIGDWVTSRAGDAYKEGITDYTPASGYKYTVDGFQTLVPDFSNCNPYVQAHTRNAYNLKDNNADGNGNALSVKFTVTDFEYEFQMALTNRQLHADAETVFLTTSADLMYLSSSVVKQVAQYGGDISGFVPASVLDAVLQKTKG